LQEVLSEVAGVVEIVVWYCSHPHYRVLCFSVKPKIQWVLQGLVQCGHASGKESEGDLELVKRK
jgi:hypothetical protein